MSAETCSARQCDLCGSRDTRPVIALDAVSMSSDSRILQVPIRKVECVECGLVRSDDCMSASELVDHYTEAYCLGTQAAQAEPLIFTADGTVTRSRAAMDWIYEALHRIGITSPRSIMEVGCGEGSLMQRMIETFPNSRVAGVDLGQKSVEVASRNGLTVSQGDYETVTGSYDLIIAFAVIEHVPSPRNFLQHLLDKLTPDGVLLTLQPCQDHCSYDIFFVDHLHHFFSDHFQAYAGICNATEVYRDSDNPLIPNFSLHVLRPGSCAAPDHRPAQRHIHETIAAWQRIFDTVDKWLAPISDNIIRVWGIGQTFTFLQAYTALRDARIEAAYDDNPDRFPAFEPRVGRFEEGSKNTSEVPLLLTFAPSAAVRQRIEQTGQSFFTPFLDH